MPPHHPTGRWMLSSPGAGTEATSLANSSDPVRTGDEGHRALQDTAEFVHSSSRHGLGKPSARLPIFPHIFCAHSLVSGAPRAGLPGASGLSRLCRPPADHSCLGLMEEPASGSGGCSAEASTDPAPALCFPMNTQPRFQLNYQKHLSFLTDSTRGWRRKSAGRGYNAVQGSLS